MKVKQNGKEKSMERIPFNSFFCDLASVLHIPGLDSLINQTEKPVDTYSILLL